MRDSCLLCNSPVPLSSPTSGSRSRISNQLRVVFLLRHVFEVPRESLELHLATHHGHPSEWIDLCDMCQDTVRKAHRIYQEFLKISRILRSVKIDIIEVTRRSFQNVSGGGGGSGGNKDQDEDDVSNVNVTITSRKIRQFVNNYNYAHYFNTFTVTPEQFEETGPEKVISEPEVKVEPNDVDAGFQVFANSKVDLVGGGDEDFEDEVRRNREIDNSDSGDGDALSAIEGTGGSDASDGSDSDDDSTYSEQCRRRSTSSKSRTRRFKGRRPYNKSAAAAIGRQRAKEYEMKRNARKLIRDANTLYLPCPFCQEKAKDYSDEGEKTLCDHLEECQYLLKVTSAPEPKLKCPTCTTFQCSSSEEQEMNAKARFVEHLGFCKASLAEGHRRRHPVHDFGVIPLEKRIFVCSVCPKKVYMMLDEFIRHIVYHQKNTFQCTKYQILLETSSAVEHHWQLEHDVDDYADGDPKWTQEPVILPAADWWCPLCNSGPFSTDDARDEHLKTSHSGEEFSGVQKTRSLGCSWCPKQFSSKLELRLHRNTFHYWEHNSFKCDHVDCQNQSEFQTESELREHRVSQHQLAFLYSCHLCGEPLASRHIWLHHLEAHQKAAKNSQTCEFCNKAFRTALMLKRHIRVDHEKLDRVPCDLCEKTFKNEFHLRSHLACHGLGDIPCTQEGCAQKFPTQRKLTMHLAKVHKIGEFKCSICDKGFYTRTLLLRHGRIHLSDRPHRCHICGKGFKDQWNLKLHVSLHEKPNFRPTKEWDRVDLDGSRRSGGPTPGVCDLCGKMVRNLTTHQKICHGPNSSKKTRKRATRAKQSKKKTGESPKKPKKDPVTCDLCGRMVKHLYHHKSQVHGDSSGIPHICDICGQSFRCRVYLNTHVRHTHEKRLSKVCETCGQGFSSTVHLTDHMVSKHGLESTQQFSCTFEGCDKIFKLKRQLYLHKKSHSSDITPKECYQCGKTFKSSNVLARHLKTHKNRESKPYQCEGCHKRFAVRDYLNQHVKNHCPNKCANN